MSNEIKIKIKSKFLKTVKIIYDILIKYDNYFSTDRYKYSQLFPIFKLNTKKYFATI